MEETKIIERLVAVEEGRKSNTKRIDKIEEDIGEIRELTIAVKEVAIETREMRKDLNDVNGRLKTVEEKPVKTFDNIKLNIITGIISLIIGAIGGTFFSLILK